MAVNALPVIARELRSEARNSMNYGLRLASAAVMLGMLAACYVGLEGRIGGRGNYFFSVLQPTLFSLIWLLGPIMTCDCISKERRDGTLGLLFLTPLRPVDVGLAKALSGILRAFTLILAALPVIALPLLMGGVSGSDVLRAAMMDLMALLGAISAGLYASSRCREFSRAALLSLLLSGVALIVLGNVQVVYLLFQLFAGNLGPIPNEPLPVWVTLGSILVGPWVLCSGVAGIWQQPPMVTNAKLLWLCLIQVGCAVLLLLWTLILLNRNLRRLSVETGMTQRELWWWRIFCTPRIFKGFLSSAHRGLLNRNPIGWLQRRTWTARAATWGWLGALLIVETAVVTSSPSYEPGWNDLKNTQPFIALFLGVAITFSAADSFRKERETGALELLLVTPLTERQVIFGRLFGLWGQYLPVFLVLICTWWYIALWQLWGQYAKMELYRNGLALIYLAGFVFLPVIGLNQSLQRRNFFAAWLTTTMLGLVIPFLLPLTVMLTSQWFWRTLTRTPTQFEDAHFISFVGAAAILQLLGARRALKSARSNLSERRFALGK